MLLGAALGTPLHAAQTVPAYYVSPSGNDSWTGLSATHTNGVTGPLATLARAQTMMQSGSTKTVYVETGTYKLGGTLVFTSSDNGESWLNVPGQAPVIDGASAYGLYLDNLGPLTIEGFTFQHMAYVIPGFGGATTAVFLYFTNAITLRWNTFLNCNDTCVVANQTNNSIIDSNTINGSSPGNVNGSTASAYTAISLTYGSSNNQVTHNLVENCQGGGIGMGGGPTDPPTDNNLIDRNILKNVDTNVVDMGALYMYDTSHAGTGNKITNNVITNNGGTAYATNETKAIYLDEGASNVLVSGNICQHCGSFATQIHSGNNNTFTNNVFDLSTSGSESGMYQVVNGTYCLGGSCDNGMTGNTFTANIIYSTTSFPSSFWFVGVNADDSLAKVSGNVYYSANGSSIPNGPSIVDSNPVYVNPEFTQPSAGNYSMPASSPAYTAIEFQSLATDQGPVGRAGGFLTGAGSSATTAANLTTEGTKDWAHWGLTSLTRMSGVTPQIGPWSIVGSGQAMYYTNDARLLSFTNGTSPTAATVSDGIYVNGQSGFSFTAPAGTSAHTLTVHVGGYYSGGTLKAHLSDGSAADFVDTTSSVNGSYDRNYVLSYQAASAGQTLTISWVRTSGTGNVTLNGAAL